MMSDLFGEVVRDVIAGADYPANRDNLVLYAQDRGAETVVIEALGRIPDRSYDSADEVVVEVVNV